jgi:hypothetical protein
MEVSSCYGRTFLKITQMVHDEPISGKVFGYFVDQPGPFVREWTATFNREVWVEGSACSDFEKCCQLSQGTLLMKLALKY